MADTEVNIAKCMCENCGCEFEFTRENAEKLDGSTITCHCGYSFQPFFVRELYQFDDINFPDQCYEGDERKNKAIKVQLADGSIITVGLRPWWKFW